MTKLTEEQSQEIYELATSANRTMSNVEIGKKFDISERVVRFHVKKWENKLHEIAKTNEKAAAAVTEHFIDIRSDLKQVLNNTKYQIQQARDQGVSPEKIAPLLNSWIKGLELASKLAGDIDASPQVNIQLNQQNNNFEKVVLEEINEIDKQRIIARIRPHALY